MHVLGRGDPPYIIKHVELGYATTAYRAQGATVDTTHAVISASTMTREALYVAMTCGRTSNIAYVITDPIDGVCEPYRSETRTAYDIVTAVLSRTGADDAAHARDPH